ncbi:MAG TPA: TraR/DksA C4-type zinc finger protein [Thermoanaerobaculia bacterium]|nr:TraR/DksA C4-type zinc finger protein [Thermoanaerobaculia bacterium]
MADVRPVDLELPIGRLTRIDAIQMQAMAQLNRHQLGLALSKIEAALDSFDSGIYGLCRHCRRPIAASRLEALPEAPFCLECQEGFERGG